MWVWECQPGRLLKAQGTLLSAAHRRCSKSGAGLPGDPRALKGAAGWAGTTSWQGPRPAESPALARRHPPGRAPRSLGFRLSQLLCKPRGIPRLLHHPRRPRAEIGALLSPGKAVSWSPQNLSHWLRLFSASAAPLGEGAPGGGFSRPCGRRVAHSQWRQGSWPRQQAWDPRTQDERLAPCPLLSRGRLLPVREQVTPLHFQVPVPSPSVLLRQVSEEPIPLPSDATSPLPSDEKRSPSHKGCFKAKTAEAGAASAAQAPKQRAAGTQALCSLEATQVQAQPAGPLCLTYCGF